MKKAPQPRGLMARVQRAFKNGQTSHNRGIWSVIRWIQEEHAKRTGIVPGHLQEMLERMQGTRGQELRTIEDQRERISKLEEQAEADRRDRTNVEWLRERLKGITGRTYVRRKSPKRKKRGRRK